MDSFSKGYLSGLIDGEGYFYISKSRGRYKREYVYQPYFGITMREREPLQLFIDQYGGKLTDIKGRGENHNDYFEWKCNGNRLRRICEEFSGALVVKVSQISIIKDFMELQKKTGNQPVSDENYSEQEKLYWLMRKANKRGKL